MVRLKARYLVLEVVWKDRKIDTATNEGVLLASIKESLGEIFGEHAVASALNTLQIKMYDPVSGICLLKCGFSDYTKVWCAITFMTNIRQRPVAARLVQLSGNLGIAKRATKAACWAAVEGRALPSQHAKAFQAGQAKLELVEL